MSAEAPEGSEGTLGRPRADASVQQRRHRDVLIVRLVTAAPAAPPTPAAPAHAFAATPAAARALAASATMRLEAVRHADE